MKKIGIITTLIGCVIFSHHTMAATLHDNMVTLATGYANFSKASTVIDAQQALDQMRLAALDSKQSKPKKLQNLPEQNAQVKDYQKGLDQLIAEIDKTSQLLKANQLQQAKNEGKQLLRIRDENHKKFK